MIFIPRHSQKYDFFYYSEKARTNVHFFCKLNNNLLSLRFNLKF